MRHSWMGAFWVGLGTVLVGGGCDTRSEPVSPSDNADTEDLVPMGGVDVEAGPSEASLRSLTVSPGTFAPEFQATTTRYTVTLPTGSSTVTVQAVPTNPNASVVQETPAGQGSVTSDSGASYEVGPPSTSIALRVTSEDGTASRSYRVTVRFESDEMNNSNDNSSAPVLDAPSNFRVTGVTERTVGLAWDLLAGATNYTLFRDTNENGTFSTVAGSTTNTVFADLNLAPATTYFYRLQATNSASVGTLTGPVPATTLDEAGIEFGSVACVGTPVFNDVENSVSLEVQVDVRQPGDSRVPVDAVTIDLRDLGQGAFESMSRQGSSAIWSIDAVFPMGFAVGTYAFPVTAVWESSEELDEGPTCVVEMRPTDDAITISTTTLTPDTITEGVASSLVITADVAVLVGTPTIDEVVVDASSIGLGASVALLDDGAGDDATAGDGTFTVTLAAPGSLAVGMFGLVITASGTGSDGALSAMATETLTIVDMPQLVVENGQVAPDFVFGDSGDTVTFSLDVIATGGASVDGATADLTALGGGAAVPMIAGSPSADTRPYSLDYSVPSDQATGEFAIILSAAADGGALTDSAPATITVGRRYTVATMVQAYSTTVGVDGVEEALVMGAVDVLTPFAIQFYGMEIPASTMVSIRSNGTLSFAGAGIPAGTTPTDSAGYLADGTVVPPLVAALHHEPLMETLATDGVYTVETRPGSWIIEWVLSAGATGSASFQIEFFESPAMDTPDFQMSYGAITVEAGQEDAYSIVTIESDRAFNDVVIPDGDGATNPAAALTDTVRSFTY